MVEAALLEKFAPDLVLHPDEKWRPCGVEESLKATGARVPLSFPNVRQLSLHPYPHDRIDFPATMTQPDLPLVGYRRQVEQFGFLFLQYWFWWLYNPGPPFLEGEGKHEGDLEFVQVQVAKDGAPSMVTCSQHHSGGKREYWSCVRRGPHPVVFAALGSHACYFTPGVHPLGPDVCGDGLRLSDFEWRDLAIQPWVDWNGLMGNSTGVGSSPPPPARQTGHRWKDPALFQSAAKSQ